MMKKANKIHTLAAACEVRRYMLQTDKLLIQAAHALTARTADQNAEATAF